MELHTSCYFNSSQYTGLTNISRASGNKCCFLKICQRVATTCSFLATITCLLLVLCCAQEGCTARSKLVLWNLYTQQVEGVVCDDLTFTPPGPEDPPLAENPCGESYNPEYR